MLIRTIFFFVALVAVAIGVDKLATQPGVFVLNWHGWQIETSAAFFVVSLGFVFLLFFFGVKTFVWLDLLPKRLAHHVKAQRHKNGLTALSDSMTALSIGEHEKALQAAKKAKKVLPKLPLADAVLAQATAAVDIANADWFNIEGAAHKKAIAYYNKLLDNTHTNPMGLKGLLQISLQENDGQRALTYAQELYEKNPKNQWVLEVLIDLYARNAQFDEAAEKARELQKIMAPHYFAKETQKIKDIRLLEAFNTLEDIKEITRLNNLGQPNKAVLVHAESETQKLLKKMPNFVPASQYLVKIYRESANKGDKSAHKKAEKLLTKTFHQSPSYKLADAWFDLMKNEPNETLIKQVDKFIGPWHDHTIGATIKAKTLIQARKWSEAGKVLEQGLQKGEDKNLLETYAQLEKAQHPAGGGAVRWLERALQAPEQFSGDNGFVNAYQNWRQGLVRKSGSQKGAAVQAHLGLQDYTKLFS